MKQKSVFAIICVICLFLVIVTISRDKSSQDGDLTKLTGNTDPNITMMLFDIDPNKCNVRILLKNNSDSEVTFGAEYSIQIKSNAKWKNLDYINDNVTWNAYGIPIGTEDEYGIDLDWSSVYGRLAAGEYRLIKSYCNPDKSIGYVVAEFAVF